MYRSLMKLYNKLPLKVKYIVRVIYNVFYLEIWSYIRAMTIFRFSWPKSKDGKVRDISQYGVKVFSQNGEDGIIKIIFDTIGTTNKTCIEF